jgi:dTDP-4-amino-4,6-dideoxygalactose transaminase
MSQISVPFVDLAPEHQPLQAEIEAALQQVVDQGSFILGPAVQALEQEFAQYSGATYGVGVACGTDAITLGLQACGIGAGAEVLVPANTFIATLLGIHKTRAKPVLVDCDPETALIDLEAAAGRVTQKTRAIMPVHLYGQMVAPKALLDFAQAHNLLVFEDAAQAHGAQREGYRAGSIGQLAAFSFYPSKNLGSMGNGGMVVTQDQTIAQRVKTLRNYGAPQKYFHTDLGTNSRLDTLQAAVLRVKLPHLDRWNQQRYQAAQAYDRCLAPLKSLGIQPILNSGGPGHVYHLYVVRLLNLAQSATLQSSPTNSQEGLASDDARQKLQQLLNQKGIQTGIHYPIPCHLQPAFDYLKHQPGDFPHSETLCQTILSLSMYPGLQDNQIEQVARGLQEAIEEL